MNANVRKKRLFTGLLEYDFIKAIVMSGLFGRFTVYFADL